MVSADVSRLMRHDAGEFRFFVRVKDQAGVDIEEAPGQGHRVDLVRVDDLDGEGNLAVRVLDYVLADTVHILRYDRVSDEPGALFDFGGISLAHLDFSIGGVPVPHSTSADVAVADRADVLDAPRLHTLFVATDFNDLCRINIDCGHVTRN